MKLVTFNRAMAPFSAGESKLVDDETALRLQDEGAISSSSDFPARTESGFPVVPSKPLTEKPQLSLPGVRRPQNYRTK